VDNANDANNCKRRCGWTEGKMGKPIIKHKKHNKNNTII
jgi:hypothetical protein